MAGIVSNRCCSGIMGVTQTAALLETAWLRMCAHAIAILACTLAVPSLTIAQGLTIEVVEVARTTGSRAAPFGTIGSMVESAPDTVIISDDVTPALHRWVPSTGSVTVVARSGRGPGEVLTPVSLARRPDGGFAVYDVGHSGVLFFDGDHRFESVARLQEGFVSNPKSLAVLADGSFILSGGRMRDPRHLHRYESSGQLVESFGDPSPQIRSDMNRIQSAGGALRVVENGGVLFSLGSPLTVMRFSGGQLRSPTVLARDSELLPELSDDNLQGPPEPRAGGARPFLWWHDRSTGVFMLPGGRVLNVVTRYYQGDSVWDVYESDGTRLARTIVPRAYIAWDMIRDGRILASYRDPDTDEQIATVLQVNLR